MMALMIAVLAMIPPDAGRYPATLTECHDGDTCRFTLEIKIEDVYLGFGMSQHIVTQMRDQPVRFCDINAPELSTPEGEVSRQKTLAWIQGAKVVEVQLTGTREKYGRLLGWVYADGISINERLVKEGFATPYLGCLTRTLSRDIRPDLYLP